MFDRNMIELANVWCNIHPSAYCLPSKFHSDFSCHFSASKLFYVLVTVSLLYTKTDIWPLHHTPITPSFIFRCDRHTKSYRLHGHQDR